MLSKPPPGTKVLPTGVICKLKTYASGSPARLEARLLARGNLQTDVIDYTELYDEVACIQLVRLVLSVEASKSWDIEQVNVKGAFLHATLPESDYTWIRTHAQSGRCCVRIRSVCTVSEVFVQDFI